MYKVDLHTHSVASPDGSLTLAHYQRALTEKRLDYIAITDHNRIDFALAAHAVLGKQIIVGEEVMTRDGEVVGLFLRAGIPSGLPLAETLELIHAQGGVTYIPHPFETARKGVSAAALQTVAEAVDIVEVRNGRALFQNRGQQAEVWARDHHKPGAAASDAHGWYGWGKTYSLIDRVPSAQNLSAGLKTASHTAGSPGLRGVLYPKFNRIRGFRHAS